MQMGSQVIAGYSEFQVKSMSEADSTARNMQSHERSVGEIAKREDNAKVVY